MDTKTIDIMVDAFINSLKKGPESEKATSLENTCKLARMASIVGEKEAAKKNFRTVKAYTDGLRAKKQPVSPKLLKTLDEASEAVTFHESMDSMDEQYQKFIATWGKDVTEEFCVRLTNALREFELELKGK